MGAAQRGAVARQRLAQQATVSKHLKRHLHLQQPGIAGPLTKKSQLGCPLAAQDGVIWTLIPRTRRPSCVDTQESLPSPLGSLGPRGRVSEPLGVTSCAPQLSRGVCIPPSVLGARRLSP